MQTGDLLIFHGTKWYSYILEWFGRSRISHVGIYILDPVSFGWTQPIVIESPTKQYVLHSGYGRDAEAGGTRFGVHLEPLESVVDTYGTSNVWVRSVNAVRDDGWYKQLLAIHESIHAKPYDTELVDWLHAELRVLFPEISVELIAHRTDRFWCSAMVTYVYVRLNWIDSRVPWTIVSPFELTEDGVSLKWQVQIGPSQLIESLPGVKSEIIRSK